MKKPKLLELTSALCIFLILSKTIGILLNVSATFNVILIMWYLMGIAFCILIINVVSTKKRFGSKVVITFGFFVWLSWLVHMRTPEHGYLTSFIPLRIAGGLEMLVSIAMFTYIINLFKNKEVKIYFL